MRLGWVTDIHLNFVPVRKREGFYASLVRERLDALLVGGDIGEAGSVCGFLAEMEQALRLPIYFVLGNHDFYRGSIASVRAKVARQTADSRWLRWLPETGVIPLTPGAGLIGHDSWADGRLGDFAGSDVLLNDYFLIRELLGLDKPERYARLNALGDEAADYLEKRAREALASFTTLIVLTHVPPFRDACWHQGRISGDDWLPHFACRAAGERLAPIMEAAPDRSMVVLCGHTHSEGFAQIRPNLLVYTGQAEYGDPVLQRVFEF